MRLRPVCALPSSAAYLVRAHVQRGREVDTWAGRQVSCQRRLMLGLVYFSLVAMIVVLSFLVLLYGALALGRAVRWRRSGRESNGAIPQDSGAHCEKWASEICANLWTSLYLLSSPAGGWADFEFALLGQHSSSRTSTLHSTAAAGVKFERAQTKQWIVATLLSFVSDALVTEPAMELLKVVAALLLMLWQHSVKGAIMHALAAKRDAARLRLKLARAQQIIEARDRLAGGRDGAPTAAGGGLEGGLASPKGSVGAAGGAPEHAALPELRRYGVADLLSEWPGRR